MITSSTTIKSGWKVWRFDQMATNVNIRIDNPSESGMEHYVGLEHLDADSLKIRRWGTPEDVEATKLMFKKGDIIFGRRRAYQRKLGVAEFDGICSAHAMVLRAKPDVIIPEFLPFFMQSDLFMKRAVEISVGSLSPTINWKTMAAQEFELPPIEQQRCIGDLLKGYANSLDALHDMEQSARKLRMSLLFDRAEAIRKNRSVTLESVVAEGRPITYGIVKPGLPHPGGIPVIKVRDFPDGVVLEDDLLLTSPDIEKDYKRSRLLPGDLLFSIRGTVGRMAFVPDTLEGAQITQDTARLTIGSNFDPRYVRYMLESPNAVSQVKANTMGLAVQGINLGDLRKVTIPACDLDQQVELADELDEISQGIRSVINRTNHTLRQFAAARENVLMGQGDV